MTEFERLFDRTREADAEAPGRVNLIGEHTDYNGGFVLPTALPLRMRAEIGLRADRTVRALSVDMPAERAAAGYERGAERRTGGWIDYVQGITQALDRRRIDVPGFDLRVSSRLPVGAGLASSAALEVAVLRALRAACSLRLDDVELARVAHEAETGLVGAPVGIMDQMAASLADEDTALFLDARTLAFERVPLPENAELAILDSGITHRHATGEYRERRAECERAAALLGVAQLRDLSEEDLPRLAGLPPPLDRRARHVVTENARVFAAVRAMREQNPERLGRLFLESHESMRRDYEVSVPDIDAIVRLAADHPFVLGARLTGGGFGGAVILLCESGTAAGVALDVVTAYRSETKRPGRILLPPGAPGE